MFWVELGAHLERHGGTVLLSVNFVWQFLHGPVANIVQALYFFEFVYAAFARVRALIVFLISVLKDSDPLSKASDQGLVRQQHSPYSL